MSPVADQHVPALLEAAGREFYFKKFGDFRSEAAGDAVRSPGQIGTLEAAHALAGLNRAIRDKSVAKLVEKAQIDPRKCVVVPINVLLD